MFSRASGSCTGHAAQDRYAIGEKTDDELAEDKEDEFSVLLGTITIEQWRDVLAVEGRGLLLSAAAHGGWSAVVTYLGSIRGKAIPAAG